MLPAPSTRRPWLAQARSALVAGAAASVHFEVVRFACCYFFARPTAPIAWSVEPRLGARIDRASGVLAVDAHTPPGTTFTVRASIDGGRRVLTGSAHVYTAESNPLVGGWQQVGWKLCTPVAQLPAAGIDPPIGELVFHADGRFSVTWTPRGDHRDYRGQYRYDNGRGSIEMRIDSGAFVPRDFAGRGTFRIESGQLVLRHVRLGTKQATQRPAICELTFTRGAVKRAPILQ